MATRRSRGKTLRISDATLYHEEPFTRSRGDGSTYETTQRIYTFLCKRCFCEIRIPSNQVSSRYGFCKSCSTCRENRKTVTPPYISMYTRLVNNSKHRNILVEITYEQYLGFVSTPSCHYCKVLVPWKRHGGTVYLLDRKDNDLPYTVENCVVCCARCNKLKSASLSYEVFLDIGAVLCKHEGRGS